MKKFDYQTSSLHRRKRKALSYRIKVTWHLLDAYCNWRMRSIGSMAFLLGMPIEFFSKLSPLYFYSGYEIEAKIFAKWVCNHNGDIIRKLKGEYLENC